LKETEIEMTSTRALVEGLENCGEVEIRKITHQPTKTGAGRDVGIVYVPDGYPGSSNVGPERRAFVGVVSYDGGETWALL
jgi:hypothetical protein